MAMIMKISLLVIFLTTAMNKVEGQCTMGNLKLNQVRTGSEVQKKPQWKVTVNNDCICTQLNIQLSCSGFQTVENIDPSILEIGKETCLLVKDVPMNGFTNVSFTYAWDTLFPFKILSSNIACS